MVLIRSPKPWQRQRQRMTSETVFYQRRRLLKGLGGMGIGMAAFSTASCVRQSKTGDPSELAATFKTSRLEAERNTRYTVNRSATPQDLAAGYNNFYEFGGNKQIWKAAQKLPLNDWQVEVTGQVNNPRTYNVDDLKQRFPLEERIYRFRCVEAWAMVVPWVGFPMRALLKEVEPKATAKFVRFTSFYDPAVCPGPGFLPGSLPWPYTEGLSIAEMANELAFFAVGIYGRELPKQHGAPLRMVLPWKYGFKGAKSIVKIEFLDQQPATFWNSLSPNEYGFTANVDPKVPHPRWSQSQERLLGTGSNSYAWEKQPTLPYNGYEEYVGKLYS
ncbi:protein-methionine-sulfoxide reductase catalytic subunit MsrP [Acaryochloris thomasi]|nr:protein-methionine-sulfoxide reductase catalytic subunit MsrP [Acaryochloris thomasi]